MMEADFSPDVELNQNYGEILEECDISTDSLPEGSSSESSVPDGEEYNRRLQSRILSLRETICSLKTQLKEEREIWSRELEERRENDYLTRATQVGLDYYSDYETDIQRYQTAIMQSHYENRHQIQKQIAFANYKRRLLEVENMCNLELLRVKQSVQILQPLQLMASEWKLDENGDSGDFSKKKIENEIEKGVQEGIGLTEVSMPLEMMIGNKIQNSFGTTSSEPIFPEKTLLISEKYSQSQPNITVSDKLSEIH